MWTTQDQSSSDRIHFPGLNAIRFYAAMSVLIAHTSDNAREIHTSSEIAHSLNLLAMDAQSAVSLFFVLSGFLITFLMLQEQSSKGRLDINRFYIRRALRIWPLYYLTVLIGLVLLSGLVLPSATNSLPPWSSILLVLLFLPNFVTGLGPLGHLWSIGLEEQFYLSWPWAVRQTTTFVRIAIGVIVVKVIIAPAVALINVDSVTNLYVGLRFECMAIGALGAYIYHRQHKLLIVVYHRATRVLVLAIVMLVVLVDLPLSELSILLTSITFIVLLLNVATGPAIGRKFENPIIDSLGMLSYGIYMYHYPILYVVLTILNLIDIRDGPTHTTILYTSTVGLTLITATISYLLFEQRFLAIKSKFSIIQSQQ